MVSAGGNGADNLCNEMSNLMHDYEVISRINDLVGMLKGNYKELNCDVTKRVLTTIQGSIQKKDEEMAWVDSCCLQLVNKNKSGKEETYTFQTENPRVKQEWITELRLAQLALETNNSPAWVLPEQEHRPLTKMPLFVKAQPVYKSQHQTEVSNYFEFHKKLILIIWYFISRYAADVTTQRQILHGHQLDADREVKIMYGYVQAMVLAVI